MKNSAKDKPAIVYGLVFESVSEAAREAGLSKGALNELCNGKRYRRSLGGRHFAFVEHVGQRWVA